MYQPGNPVNQPEGIDQSKKTLKNDGILAGRSVFPESMTEVNESKIQPKENPFPKNEMRILP